MSVFSPGSEEGSPMLAMSASPLPSGDCRWDGVWDCDWEVPWSPASDTILYPPWPSRCGGRTTPDRSPSRYPPTHVPRLQSAGSMSVRPQEDPPPFEPRSRCCGIHGSSSTRRSGFPPLPRRAHRHTTWTAFADTKQSTRPRTRLGNETSNWTHPSVPFGTKKWESVLSVLPLLGGSLSKLNNG